MRTARDGAWWRSLVLEFELEFERNRNATPSCVCVVLSVAVVYCSYGFKKQGRLARVAVQV